MLLKDGRVIEGDHVQVAGVAENPLDIKITAGEVAVLPLLMFDDGLRRTFIHSGQVARVLEDAPQREVRIHVWQDVAEAGPGIGRVGRGRPLEPFDEFGRRIYEMQSRDGPLAIVQGITEITPIYTKVEGLMGAPRPIVWDMRMATSSIPREMLKPILKTAVQAGRRRRPAGSRAALPAERALPRRGSWSSRRSSRISRNTKISTNRSRNCGNSARA